MNKIVINDFFRNKDLLHDMLQVIFDGLDHFVVNNALAKINLTIDEEDFNHWAANYKEICKSRGINIVNVSSREALNDFLFENNSMTADTVVH